MPGVLKNDMVVVSDQKEGSQIYNKGNYGYPISKGGLDLDLLEATYLLESKRLEVTHNGENMSFEELFRHSSQVHEDFDIRYMVYRDIRQRGFVIKSETGGFDFSVLPRGKTLSSARPEYMVKAVSERAISDTHTFQENAMLTAEKGRKLLYGVVDEEGDLTYYVVSSKMPTGSISVHKEEAINGSLIKDRVFVFSEDDSKRLYDNGYFGKMTDGTLQLSLIESCYLVRKGLLNVISSGKTIGSDELMQFSDSVQDEFQIRFSVFSALRDEGLLVKTGFKYGTHFRVYEKQPDECHARYLVHSMRDDRRMTWPEISRAVRLAHGVKKEILFCDQSLRYTEFKRFRP